MTDEMNSLCSKKSCVCAGQGVSCDRAKFDSISGLPNDRDRIVNKANAPNVKLLKRKIESLGCESFDEVPSLKSRTINVEAPSPKGKTKMNRCTLNFRTVSELSGEMSDQDPEENDKFFPATLHNNGVRSFLHLDGVDPKLSEAGINSDILFPELTVTVSEASCSTAFHSCCSANTTKNKPRCFSSDGNTTDDSSKASYGWFVELDDCVNDRNFAQCNTTESHSRATFLGKNLAFASPIGSMVVNEDPELAWAQAADTIDSIFDDIEF